MRIDSETASPPERTAAHSRTHGQREHAARGYLLAFASIAAVLLVRLALWPVIGNNFPFLLTLLAVLVSAGYGGRGPGLLAVTLGAFAGTIFFFLDPVFTSSTFSAQEMHGLLLYAVAGLGITELSQRLVATRRRAERTEQQFAAEEERYRQLVNNIAEYAIIGLDREGVVTDWNAAAERIGGWRAEEILGRNYSLFFTPEDRATRLPDKTLRLATEQGHYTSEGWRVRKNGTEFWADVSITALRDQDGALRGFSEITRDLTERRQAEESRRETESTLRALLESATQTIVAVDRGGRITVANATAERMFGYSREEMAALSVDELLPERFRHGHAAMRESYFAEPRTRPMGMGRDLSARRKDGSEFPVEISLSTIDTRSGLQTVAFVSDITERKLVEEAVKRQARLLDLSHEPIFASDLGGSITFWNRGAELLYGWSREQALGQVSHELLHTVYPVTPASIERQLQESGSWVGEVVQTARDGRRIVVESRRELVHEPGRRLLVLETNRDITERKRSEEQIRELATTLERRVEERTHQLEEQRLFLQAVLDTVEVAIVSCDTKGQLNLLNRTARAWLGSSEPGVPPEGWAERYSLYEADGRTPLARDRIPLVRALHGQAVRDAEMVIRTGGAPPRFVLTSGQPLVDQHGHLLGAVIAMHDVTLQKSAEEELRQSNNRLQEANKELEAFSYSVSHDLRAPLRSIEGFSNILVRDHSEVLPAKAQELLGRIRVNTVRMGQLIEALLSLSRLSRAELRREHVNLGALSQIVVNDLRAREPERHVSIRIRTSLFADADPRLMRVVLENLIGNAWKFTRNVPEPRIEVGCRHDEPVYYVRDNGAGFDMAYYNHLFAPFQRLHRATEFEGSGIGLATVARIIHRHGGRIWAESEPGKGATFHFTVK